LLYQELRLRIYELAVAFPVETIDLQNVSSTIDDQSWICGDATVSEDCTFYPYGMKRIPENLQNEALAVAYQSTIFRVTQMDQIPRLYPMIGRVGLENIETIHIDWIKTEEVSFAAPSAIDHHDTQALQVISLLKTMTRLRHLSVQLNGYAFTLAYANVKYRRTCSLDKHNDLFETYRLMYIVSHYFDQQGNRVALADEPIGKVVELPQLGKLWKVSRTYDFVPFLHLNIARCDPFFGALAGLSGLKSFDLKQSIYLPGGLDESIEQVLRSIVTDPVRREPGENRWFRPELDDLMKKI
jgi:hypothetical protein